MSPDVGHVEDTLHLTWVCLGRLWAGLKLGLMSCKVWLASAKVEPTSGETGLASATIGRATKVGRVSCIVGVLRTQHAQVTSEGNPCRRKHKDQRIRGRSAVDVKVELQSGWNQLGRATTCCRLYGSGASKRAAHGAWSPERELQLLKRDEDGVGAGGDPRELWPKASVRGPRAPRGSCMLAIHGQLQALARRRSLASRALGEGPHFRVEAPEVASDEEPQSRASPQDPLALKAVLSL